VIWKTVNRGRGNSGCIEPFRRNARIGISPKYRFIEGLHNPSFFLQATSSSGISPASPKAGIKRRALALDTVLAQTIDLRGKLLYIAEKTVKRQLLSSLTGAPYAGRIP